MKKIGERITRPVRHGYKEMRKQKETGRIYFLILVGYFLHWLIRGDLNAYLIGLQNLSITNILEIPARILIIAFVAMLLVTGFWNILSQLPAFWRYLCAVAIGFCITEITNLVINGIDITTLLH